MQYYKAIKTLIKEFKELPYPGRVYMQGEKNDTLQSSEYWAISSKEAKDQDYIETKFGKIPESLVQYNAKSLIDVGTFKSIIENKLEHNPNLSLDDTAVFLEAIEYYLENDDFLD